VLRSKPYQYAGHFLPHDGNDSRFKFATGLTIKEQLRAVLPDVRITPKLSIEDGIQALRFLLGRKTRIHKTNCKLGLEALENYHREYDEDTRTYSKTPVHDWSSHYADGARYMAVSINGIRELSAPPPPKKPVQNIMTLDNLFDDYDARGRFN
jgi:phage terminase large subunit